MIYLKAVFLAVIEGLTEFLPISSTGHMILADKYVQLSTDKPFVDSFLVMIQLPAILAVVAYFWKDLWPFMPDRRETESRLTLWSKIIIAFLPAAALGAVLHKTIEERLFNPLTVALTLLIGGIVLIVLENRRSKPVIMSSRDITYRTALMIGAIQCIAMVPGTSRSAATIIGAMVLGASRFVAAEFSFYLAIPTMFGATAFVVMKNGLHFTGEEWVVVSVASVVSFAVAYSVVAFLMRYIQRHDFKPFAYYRIGLAVAVLILLHRELTALFF